MCPDIRLDICSAQPGACSPGLPRREPTKTVIMWALRRSEQLPNMRRYGEATWPRHCRHVSTRMWRFHSCCSGLTDLTRSPHQSACCVKHSREGTMYAH